MKLLYIKANCKPNEDSRTFRVSDLLVREYKDVHPETKVEVVDLYSEGIGFLHKDDLGKLFGPKDENAGSDPLLKYAYQFVEADRYVVAAPMWNLGIPAMLKAYIDYITVVGVTFNYTPQGPQGLLMGKGKKVLHVVSRGGVYTEGPYAPYEMGDRYLRTIFGFLGLTDFDTLAIEGVDVQGQDVNGILTAAEEKAKHLARTF